MAEEKIFHVVFSLRNVKQIREDPCGARDWIAGAAREAATTGVQWWDAEVAVVEGMSVAGQPPNRRARDMPNIKGPSSEIHNRVLGITNESLGDIIIGSYSNQSID